MTETKSPYYCLVQSALIGGKFFRKQNRASQATYHATKAAGEKQILPNEGAVALVVTGQEGDEVTLQTVDGPFTVAIPEDGVVIVWASDLASSVANVPPITEVECKGEGEWDVWAVCPKK